MDLSPRPTELVTQLLKTIIASDDLVTAADGGGEAGPAQFKGWMGEVKILATPSRYPILKTDLVSGVVHS